MIFSSLSPSWFLGFDAILAVLFLLITGVIALYAFKAYRFTGQRRFLWWAIGFLSLTAGYAVSAFANYYLYARIIQAVSSPVPGALDFNWLHFLGHLANTGCFIGGYLLLAMVMLRFDDTRLITLFTSIVAVLSIAIVLSGYPLLLTLTNVVLLGHIVFFIWFSPTGKHEQQPKVLRPTLKRLVAAGFLLLFLGQLAYLLLPLAESAYVVGNAFELLGFTLLAASMLLILKK